MLINKTKRLIETLQDAVYSSVTNDSVAERLGNLINSDFINPVEQTLSISSDVLTINFDQDSYIDPITMSGNFEIAVGSNNNDHVYKELIVNGDGNTITLVNAFNVDDIEGDVNGSGNVDTAADKSYFISMYRYDSLTTIVTVKEIADRTA